MKKWIKQIVALYMTFISICVYSQNNKNVKETFLVVVGEKVNVRENASVNSKIIKTLPIGWRVQILKKSENQTKIEGIQGKWVFVDTGLYLDSTYETIAKGWVFDYYLADLNDFKKVKSFQKCFIEGWSGDYFLSYQFNEDGTYTRKLRKEEGQIKNQELTGKVYQYRKVIYAQDDDGRGSEIFFIDEKGILKSTIGNADGKQMECR